MSEKKALWRIGELADEVAVCLADGYVGSSSRRVRKVPDVRAIRWYTTTGLLDPPLEHRGRVAYYGVRHLHQLVAIKRLQSEGMPLTQIQQRLTGVTDSDLEKLSGVPKNLREKLENTAEPPTSARRPTSEFWKPRAGEVSDTDVNGHGAGHPSPTQLSYGIAVSDDVTILVRAQHPPSQDDIAQITAAAQPVVAKVTECGIVEQGDRGQ